METPNKPLSLRFNKEEWETHQAIKSFFGYNDVYGEDAATLKTAETFAYNVIHNLFGEKLEIIFSRKATAENVIRRQEEQKKRMESNTKQPKTTPNM